MNSENEEKNKWLNHRIKIFVSYIFRDEFEAAEEETITQKEYFDAKQVLIAAKKYHYGTEDFPPNYKIAIALYEWAHTGEWLISYLDSAYVEPSESELYMNVEEIDEDSFLFWAKAVFDKWTYEKKYIFNLDYFENHENYIIISGALSGNEKCIQHWVNLYFESKNSDEEFEGANSEYEPYLEKIFKDNDIKIFRGRFGVWEDEYSNE